MILPKRTGPARVASMNYADLESYKDLMPVCSWGASLVMGPVLF